MERIINYDQFYYTNYGQGLRFEGNSSRSTQTVKAVQLLAPEWMKLDSVKPVEMVRYNHQLNRYVAAMVVSCTRAGDARVSYWIHGVIPEENQGDGFTACLSWPLAAYQTEVLTARELETVQAPALRRDPQEICRRYGLTGERLLQLMALVWQTVCSRERPSTLYLILDPEHAVNYNETAREIMTVIYDLLPAQLQNRADYQALAEGDIQYVRFAFKEASDNPWQFRLDGQGPTKLSLAEEEEQLLTALAALYEQDPAAYRQRLEGLDKEDAENFEDFMWAYYLDILERGEALHFSQETLIRSQPYLEQRAAEHEGFRRLFCRCLSEIDTKEKNSSFVQTVMEKYMLAAAALKEKSAPEYSASLTRCWQLLDQLRAGSLEVASSYLEWLRKISAAYYQDFVERGLSEGRSWLLKILGSAGVNTADDLFDWMRDAAFLKNVTAYKSFVADKAEALYVREDVTEEERQRLLPYCRNPREQQLKALSHMRYEQLMQLDGESMDTETQNLWIHTAAKRLSDGAGRVDSPESAGLLYASMISMENVLYQIKAEDSKPGQLSGVEEGEQPRTPDREDMGILLSAIWQYELQFTLAERFLLCRIARYTSDMDLNSMSDDFWALVQPEDDETLYQLGPVSRVFKDSHHPNYYQYRLYAIYRTKDKRGYDGRWEERAKEKIAAYLSDLGGDAGPALKAIWQHWALHSEADTRLVCDMARMLAGEAALRTLAADYAASETADEGRLAELRALGVAADTGRKRLKRRKKRKGQDEAAAASEEQQPAPEESGHAAWIMTACVGLYMGLLVNGWSMTVHLAEQVKLPFLVWIGLGGIALLTAVLMVLAERLVRKDAKVSLTQMPWAGLWLFVNQVLTYFIGNKITALISLVVLAAAYIWLRAGKHHI